MGVLSTVARKGDIVIRQYGFLLIELMLAVFLFTAMVGVVMYMVKTVVDTQSAVLANLEIIHVAAYVADGGDIRVGSGHNNVAVSATQRSVRVGGKIPVTVTTYTVEHGACLKQPFIFSVV
jgi:hypothetical protein